jgi:hypothetical protein
LRGGSRFKVERRFRVESGSRFKVERRFKVQG